MKRFGLTGLAGYIAGRHLRAIKDTGHLLCAALDKSDSVGVVDSYFPGAAFFTEFERFDRHLEKLRQAGKGIDYLTICTPNYLHDSHVRFGLRLGADVICEKPLVLNPWNVDALRELSGQTGGRINVIMQLRLHEAIRALKKRIEKENGGRVHEVELTYIAPRGRWYDFSWKGDEKKSGGVATNIGIHFFDMLAWIFGDVRKNTVNIYQARRAAGVLELEKAQVKWFLSVNAGDLPGGGDDEVRTYRSIRVDGDEVEFSQGFADLHTRSYEKILAGEGFGPADVKKSIDIVTQIRTVEPVGVTGNCHRLLRKGG